MSGRDRSARVVGGAVAVMAMGMMGASWAGAQNVVYTWMGGATGDFAVGSNWFGGGGASPSGINALARIDGGAAVNADVVLSADRTIRDLMITDGDQLRLGGTAALSIDAGDSGGFPNNTFISNDGVLALGAGSLKVRGYLQHGGFGVMTLAGGEVKGVRGNDEFGTPVDYLANRGDVTGYGAVGTNFENYWKVNANVAGQTLYLGKVVGNLGGTLEASNGGRLVIAHGSGFSNSQGMIRANAGSTVELGGTVTNGTIRNDGGTFKSVGGYVRLTNVTVGGGKITFVPDAGVSDPYAAVNDLNLEGTIVNQGELAFEGSHATNPSFVGVVGQLNLRGGGMISMTQGTGATNAVRFGDGGGFVTAKVVNGRDPVGANPVVAADRHTIRGGGTFEVRVDNRRGGLIENPAGAVAGMTFMAPVTNAGEIKINTSAQVVGAFEMDAKGNSAVTNEAGGTMTADGATVDLYAATLANRGTFTAKGGSTVLMGTSSVIRNTGTFELSGGSTLQASMAFFGGVEGITNSGHLRILDSSSIDSGREFRQTDGGTITFGIVSPTEHASFTGKGVLAGTIAANGGVAGGAVYQVMNGDFRGRFSSATAPGLAGDQAVKVTYQEDSQGRRTGVAIQVVSAQKLNTNGPAVVNGLVEGVYHELSAQGGTMDVTAGGSSLGMALRALFDADPALAAKIRMKVEENAALNVDGEIYAERGRVEMNIGAGASVNATKYSVSSVSTVSLTGTGNFPTINGGGLQIGKGSGTWSVNQDGYLASNISEQFNRAQNLLADNGEYFSHLRSQVRASIQAGFGWADEALVTTTTRIIALGGGNIVAVGGGNLVIADNAFASGAVHDIYGTLLNIQSGVNPTGTTNIASLVTSFNPTFTDPGAVLGTVNGIVALGGGNLAGANYDLGAKIIANGGGNLSILSQYQAGIIAVGGANIIANGGGNLTPVVDPSHIVAVGGGNLLSQLGFTADNLSKAGIIANGGGNIVAVGGGNFGFGGGFAMAPVALAAGEAVVAEELHQFFVEGDYRQSELGMTRLYLRGGGDYDQIVATGTASLNGALAVTLSDPLAGPDGDNPYEPQPGDVFDLIVAPSFETVNGFHLMLPDGYDWQYAFTDLGNGTGALRLLLEGPVGPLPGDANGDGVIGTDDFALIDRGFAMALGGVENGDFDEDGDVDVDDYLIIDTALFNQGGSFAAGFLVEREARFGSGYVAALTGAVPEPGCVAWLVVGGVWVGRRRRNP